MLKVNIDQGKNQTLIMGSGPLDEIVTDICAVINGLYSQLKRGGNDDVAMEFRKAMVWMHTDPDGCLFEVDEGVAGLCAVTKGDRHE